MLEKVVDFFKWLWLATWQGTRLWRITITGTFTVYVLWATGAVGIAGTHGYAWADDETTYHTHIALEVAKINGSIEDLSKQLKTSDLQHAEEAAARAKEAQAATIRTLRRQIFETERDGCVAKTLEMRDLLLAQAQQLRGDFMRITNTEYPPFAGCSAYR